MSKPVERTADGQFAPGHSGNPDGARLRQPRALLTVTDLHRIQLEVASEIVGKRAGKPVSRYENIVRGMPRGDSANRLAHKDFMEMTKQAGYHFAHLARKAGSR